MSMPERDKVLLAALVDRSIVLMDRIMAIRDRCEELGAGPPWGRAEETEADWLAAEAGRVLAQYHETADQVDMIMSALAVQMGMEP